MRAENYRKIKIGYDFSVFETPTPTGVEKLGFKLFCEIISECKDFEHFIFFKNSCDVSLGGNVHYVKTPHKRFWRSAALGKAVNENKIDVFLSSVPAIPLFAKCFTIPYIHECQWLYNSHEKKSLSHRVALWLAAFKSKILFVNSQYTAQDVKRELKFLSPRLEIIYPSLIQRETKPNSELSLEEALKKLNLSEIKKYCLFISTIRPKKNIKLLIDTFADERMKDINLILVGRIDHQEFVQYSNDKNLTNVHFTGYQEDNVVKTLLENAQSVLYISQNEGFGFPVLEAFSAKCPLVASTNGSIPEIAGDAAIFVENLTVENMIDAVFQVIDKPEIRTALISKGLKRLEQFSWKNSAVKVKNIINQLVLPDSKPETQN